MTSTTKPTPPRSEVKSILISVVILCCLDVDVEMKIGIVTIEENWLRSNYGTLLQSWALQKLLREWGHNPYHILIKHPSHDVGLKKTLINFLKSPLFFVFKEWKVRKLRNKFDSFIASNIRTTERLYRRDELLNDPPAADCYICGSDQVWAGLHPAFFLAFAANKRRIAYAVSCPWSLVRGKLKYYLDLYGKKFAGVSVREDEGQCVCRDSGIENVPVVVDPVLFWDKEEYLKLICDKHKEKYHMNTPFILVYILNSDLCNAHIQAVNDYAHKKGMRVYVIAGQGATCRVPNATRILPDPSEYMALLAYANCVITNSFHGVVFSVIYRKMFVYIPQSDEFESQNCRCINFLNKIDATDRICDSSKSLYALLNEDMDINYLKLERWKDASFEFLYGVLA